LRFEDVLLKPEECTLSEMAVLEERLLWNTCKDDWHVGGVTIVDILPWRLTERPNGCGLIVFPCLH